jgi:hypothetical protein
MTSEHMSYLGFAKSHHICLIMKKSVHYYLLPEWCMKLKCSTYYEVIRKYVRALSQIYKLLTEEPSLGNC